MKDKKYLLLVSNDAKAVLVPFPQKLAYPAQKTVYDPKSGKPILYVKTDRIKRQEDDSIAPVYVQPNSRVDITEFTEPAEVLPTVADRLREYGQVDEVIEFKPAKEPFTKDEATDLAIIQYLETQLQERRKEYLQRYGKRA